MLDVLASAVTPLLIVLGGIVGLGMGAAFIAVVRKPPGKMQRSREEQIAREAARKTLDDTLHELFRD